MDGYIEHQLICRACLRIVENKTQSFGYIEDSYGNLKDMIMCCVPEMDIYVSAQPIMCFPCIQLLITVYNFKTRCLNTETVIRTYLQRNNLIDYNHVNLGCVVQELIKLNNYFREMNRSKTENHADNSHLKSTKNECNIPDNAVPETQVGVQPVSEEVKINNIVNNGVDIDPTGGDLNSHNNEEQSKHGEDSELVKNPTEEYRQIAQSNWLESQVVQKSVPPPHLIGTQNFHQNNLPVHHMGERIFHFPPPNVPYNFQDQMRERMLIPPHLAVENRTGPYRAPIIRHQIPERMFAASPFGMEQRYPPRCIVPGQIGDRVHTFIQTGIEPRLPYYNLPPTHINDNILHRPPTEIKENVTQVNRDSETQNPDAQPTEVSRESCDDTIAEKDKPPCVEDNPINENNDNDSSSEEHFNGDKIEKVNEEPVQERTRIILRIDKSRIKDWIDSYDKNEDSNEKENEHDVEMSEDLGEDGMSPPQEGIFQPPSECSQELYQCSDCMFVTTNLTSHLSHKEICPKDVHRNEKVKCPHCPHVTNRQYALKKHINTMHTRAVWYVCDFCTYRSTDPSCLRRHKRNVHIEKLGMGFTCSLCSYCCATEYHLRKHMLKHDENSILHCQFCSYSTRDRSNFRKHVFIHNPKPKECEFCDYKCVSPYQMKIHLKKYHHGVGMEDIDCRSDVSLSAVVDDISNAINESKSFVGHMVE